MSADAHRAVITHLGGPVLKAAVESDGFSINEAVGVGPLGLLGEILAIHESSVTVQVYEDTSGLEPGDPIVGSGQPLSVSLGPGLLGGIYDGLLRPLEDAHHHWVRPGVRTRLPVEFDYQPMLRPGTPVVGGERLGRIRRPDGAWETCLVPPDVRGRLIAIEPAGRIRSDRPIGRCQGVDGKEQDLSMAHSWPVRRPRPVRQRLALRRPLVTGQRIVDSLFPVALGGKAALPGGFGTGKTILLQSLAKWCDADVIVYIGCGERGNEMTAVLEEFPKLEDPRNGRPLLERSVIIANTSNMPVAAREASIYTGVTVAEYYRDQGLSAAVFADSTSRWAEALREISGRLGELPAEGGYPAYLASRKAEFYERAGRVESLSGECGSVTVVGAISPPGGDFSEPVTLHTQRNVPCFWPLDRDRAHARFYPAIHPLRAYSEYVDDLAGWWHDAGHPEWTRQRRRLLHLLEEQAHLERMARIVGKDALPPGQQLTLFCAELVNDAFLRQNAFSPVDRHASPARQAGMMQVLDRFLDRALTALAEGASVERIMTLPLVRRLRRMGEDLDESRAEPAFAELMTGIDRELTATTRGGREATQ